MEILIAVLAGWFCSISSVALGGWLVFKTKREAYEGLFTGKKPEAEVFNLDDDFSDLTAKNTIENLTKPEPFESDVMRQAQNRFAKQFREASAMDNIVNNAVKIEKERDEANADT